MKELFTMRYQYKIKKRCYTYPQSHCRGSSALILVLIISAIAVTSVTVVILSGVGTSRSSFVFEQSYQAQNLGQACTEEALQQIRDSTAFTGSGSLTLGQGSCAYTATSQGGENRTTTSTGTVGTVIQKATVIINTINPIILVTSWQEVSDF